MYVAIAYCNSGEKDFWGLFDFHLCSSTSKSTPSFSRRLFSSDKEGLEEEISDSRQFWKTRLRIFIAKPPGQHEEGEGVSKVRLVFGLHHRGNIRVRLLVRPDMSLYMVTFSMQTIIVSANCSKGFHSSDGSDHKRERWKEDLILNPAGLCLGMTG